MIAWITANGLTVICCLAVLGLVALALCNILPRKGRPSSCGGCSGCASCSGCSGCAGCGTGGSAGGKPVS